MKIPKRHTDISDSLKMTIGVFAWIVFGVLLFANIQKCSAQYTGAQPYSVEFGYHYPSYDDGEIKFINESAHDLVVAIMRHGDVVDHAFISKYQTYSFDGLEEGSGYTYKAEVFDGGNANEYVTSNLSLSVASNVCPEGYTCSGRSYGTITFYFSYSDGGNRPTNISKAEFFN